jgi:hypothetical protein
MNLAAGPIWMQNFLMKYNIGDVVLIKCAMAKAIKPFKVKLIKKYNVKKRTGNTFTWPGYIGWDAVLVNKKDVVRLRKKWQIPFYYPDKIQTFVFEEEIIKRV